MNKQTSVILIAAVVATAMMPSQSFAIVPEPPPVIITSFGGGGGAGGAGGIIGAAAFFVIYDLIRRTSCSGDFLHLGGPGFSTQRLSKLATLFRLRLNATRSSRNDAFCAQEANEQKKLAPHGASFLRGLPLSFFALG